MLAAFQVQRLGVTVWAEAIRLQRTTDQRQCQSDCGGTAQPRCQMRMHEHASIERCVRLKISPLGVCVATIGAERRRHCRTLVSSRMAHMMRVSTIAFFKLSSVVCDVTPLYQMYEAARAKQSGTWSYTHGVHGGTCKQ